jgi:hypothetical protein
VWVATEPVKFTRWWHARRAELAERDRPTIAYWVVSAEV